MSDEKSIAIFCLIVYVSGKSDSPSPLFCRVISLKFGCARFNGAETAAFVAIFEMDGIYGKNQSDSVFQTG